MHPCDWIMVRSVAQKFMGLRHCCILKVIFYYFWNNEKELASKNSQYFKHCSISRSTEVPGVYRFLRVDMACTSHFPPVIQAHDHQSRWAQNQSTHWNTSVWKLKLHVLKQTAHSLQYMVNHKNLITEIFFWNMQWKDLRVCAQRAEDRFPYKCQNYFHSKKVGHPFQSCLLLTPSPSSGEFIPHDRKGAGALYFPVHCDPVHVGIVSSVFPALLSRPRGHLFVSWKGGYQGFLP